MFKIVRIKSMCKLYIPFSVPSVFLAEIFVRISHVTSVETAGVSRIMCNPTPKFNPCWDYISQCYEICVFWSVDNGKCNQSKQRKWAAQIYIQWPIQINDKILIYCSIYCASLCKIKLQLLQKVQNWTVMDIEINHNP